MRHIEGYVCSVKLRWNELATFLFGRPVSKMMLWSDYESFESNGQVPFETLDDARVAAATLGTRSDFRDIHLERIVMVIAEGPKENMDELFLTSCSMVIVIQFDGDPGILGPAVSVAPRICNETCSPFFDGGLTPFRSHFNLPADQSDMYWPFREAQRHIGSVPLLATFELERVE